MELLDNTIFLPTRGRVDKQITLSQLPDSVLQNVWIVCHPGEQRSLYDVWGKRVKRITPVAAAHIGEVRQWCVDNSDSDYITFVDDSLDFHIRAESETGTVTDFPLKGIIEKHFTLPTRERYVFEIFNWIRHQLRTDKYGMVGVSRRSDNCHHLEDNTVLNSRMCSFWGLNRKLYRTLEGAPQFSSMPIKEDFYIYIHFLLNGIPSITSYKYAYGRVGGGPNSPGGCSIYRNTEMSIEAAEKLKRLFPNFITLKKKGTKSWKDFGDKTDEVVIKHKQAFNYGQAKRHHVQGVLFEDNK